MKIWSKLFLVAATGMMMFSSCLENIEPEGIADLRGAKAELLRANTALVEAKAARENAEAAIAQAKAKVEEAVAKQQEALAKQMEAAARLAELNAAKQEALDAIEIEQAIAEAEALKAQAELEAQIVAAELEAELVEAQTSVLTAKAEYEKALKNLELAKNGLTAEQKAYLEDYIDDVETWQADVDRLSKELSKYSIELKAAIANLDEKKASAVVLRHYEKKIIEAEAKLKGLEEVVAMFEAAMELDPKYTDWAEKIDELKAERDAKDLAFAEGATERRERETELKAVKDTLEAAYEEYADATGFAFDVVTGTFSESAGGQKNLPYPDVRVPAPRDEDGKLLFGDSYGDFELDGTIVTKEKQTVKYMDLNDKGELVQKTKEVDVVVTKPGNGPKFYYGDPSKVIKAFDDEIKKFKAQNAESKETEIAGKQAVILSYDKEYEDLTKKYEDAVKAYQAGDPVAYIKEYTTIPDYDIEKVVADYNAALKAMVEALNTKNAEYKKYAEADIQDAVQAAMDLEKEEKAVAEADYVKALQKAYDDYNAASVKYQKAKLAFERAEASYKADVRGAAVAVGEIKEAEYKITITLADDAPIADYEAVATTIGAEIKKYDDALKADPTAVKPEYTAAYNIYQSSLKQINEAQKLYDDKADLTNKTDAVDVWTAAQTAYAKAGGDSYTANTDGDYYKAVAAATKAKNTADTAAENKRKETIEDLNVGATGMNTEYQAFIDNAYTNASDALTKAVGTVKKYAVVKKGKGVEVVMGDKDFTMFAAKKVGDEWKYEKFPYYLVDAKTQALKEIKVADIVDKEEFLATTVKDNADALAVTIKISGVDYENMTTEVSGTTFEVVIAEPADYPLSFPTYETFVKAIDAFEGETVKEKAFAYAEEVYRKFANECIASGGKATGTPNTAWGDSKLSKTFQRMADIDVLKAWIANVPEAVKHVEALEKAKAEFEAWVKTEETRIDALRPRVEAEWMDVTAELNDIENADLAHALELEPIRTAITDLASLVNNYVKIMAPQWDNKTKKYDIVEQSPTDGDLEAFVAGLQDAYNEAVLKVGDCEAELEDAKTALEKAKAGDWTYKDEGGTTTSSSAQVTAVKTAQANYDKAAAELEYALSRLAEATEALKDAMEAIGAVEPEAEETPAE